MRKRIIATLLCIIIVFGIFTVPAQARWTNCASISLAMSLKNGTVSWSGSIEGNSDTIYISASYTLEKLGTNGNYNLVGYWSNLNTTRTTLDSGSSVTNTSGTYKLTLSGTVQSSTYSEPITASFIKVL